MKMLEKKCSDCEIIKDIKEFYISRSSKDGYRNKCKVCVNIYNKKYREENKNKIKEYSKVYYNENRDIINEKNKKYNEENKDRKRKYDKEYYEENRYRILENTKIYREENRDIINEKNKKWREENNDYFKEYREENKNKIKEYREENKDRIKEYSKVYREENSDYFKEYYQENKDRILIVKREYNRNRILNDPLYKLRKRVRAFIYKSLKNGGYTKNSRSGDTLGCSYEELLDHLNDNKYGFIYGDDNLDIDHIIPLSRATSEEEIIKLNHYTNLQLLPADYNRHIKRDNDFDNECLEKWLLNKKYKLYKK